MLQESRFTFLFIYSSDWYYQDILNKPNHPYSTIRETFTYNPPQILYQHREDNISIGHFLDTLNQNPNKIAIVEMDNVEAFEADKYCDLLFLEVIGVDFKRYSFRAHFHIYPNIYSFVNTILYCLQSIESFKKRQSTSCVFTTNT